MRSSERSPKTKRIVVEASTASRRAWGTARDRASQFTAAAAPKARQLAKGAATASGRVWTTVRGGASELAAVAVPRARQLAHETARASRRAWSLTRNAASHFTAIVEGGAGPMEEKVSGLAASAILAGSAAPFIMALIVQLSHFRGDFNRWLVFNERVGALSGLSIMTGVIWVGVWALLALALWGRNLPLLAVTAVAIVLIGVGLAFTFPPVTERVDPKLAFWVMVAIVCPVALAILTLALGRRSVLVALVAIAIAAGVLLTPPVLGCLGVAL